MFLLLAEFSETGEAKVAHRTFTVMIKMASQNRTVAKGSPVKVLDVAGG